MAIGIFRSLEFGGINSADYDVYITGEAVYNAPERSVETVSVPGRNGAVLIDNGYFENIEVKYPAGVTGTDQSEFASKIADFRSAVLSQIGYQRLTDEYNPNEYRMATYISGLEVEVVEGQQGTVGEFELVFNCKPQRFLTSGETAVTVANNGTITNPTLFDAKPLLQLNGYGKVAINGETMSVNSGALGKINVSSYAQTGMTSLSVPIQTQYANPGDPITVNVNLIAAFYPDQRVKSAWTDGGTGVDFYMAMDMLRDQTIIAQLPNFGYVYGTSKTGTASITVNCTMEDNSSATAGMAVSHSYNGSDTFTFSITSITNPAGWGEPSSSIEVQPMILNSSQSRLGNPLYLDLDLGEAYKIENDIPVSINSGVSLPMELPTLPPGASTITFDNTYTQVKIVPRWWQI